MRSGAQDSARECEKPNAAIAQSRFRIPAAALLSRYAKARAPLPWRKVRDAPRFPFVLVFAAAALGWTPVRAGQASFDFLKAAAPIEQLICSDPQLLTLDRALGDAFAAYQRHLPDKDRTGALVEQRSWLAARLKQCGVPTKEEEVEPEVRWRTAPCLEEMYRARLAALGAPTETPPPLPQTAEPGFIHPACLWTIVEQDSEEQAAAAPAPRIPLAACARGSRHIPVSAGNEGSFSAPGAVDGCPT
ncbi:MAG: lysozyme inhibitor LprI family protein [Bacteroidota bacterium]